MKVLTLGKEGTVGFITYMRTDSTRISDVAQQEAAEYITTQYGKEYVKTEDTKRKKQSENTQDAHEAVRPTSTSARTE